MKNSLLVIFLGMIAVIAFAGIRFLDDGKNGGAYGDDDIAQTPPAALLNTLTNSDGAVTVAVTPIDQSDWSFDVILDTHSEDLGEDLTRVSTLVDENGNAYTPVEWRGDPPGGHHRRGILRFGKIAPQPRSAALFIRQIGGVPERIFTWTTQP